MSVPSWLSDLWYRAEQLLRGHLVLVSVVLFVVLFVGSIAAVGWVLVRLPPQYFQKGYRPPLAESHPVLRWTGLIGKNLLGAALILMGVVMLIGPGQGVLTILIGLMLLNFPGKRRLERRLVRRPAVRNAIDHLRARFGRPPLELDDPPKQP